MATLTSPQVKNVGVCQKNCGIDYAKCLITKLDMQVCLQEEAACALECLKSVKAPTTGDRCTICKEIASGVAKVVAPSYSACYNASPSISDMCHNYYHGVYPDDLQCYIDFKAECEKIKKSAGDGSFDANLTCIDMQRC
jgi:hypothetical protein